MPTSRRLMRNALFATLPLLALGFGAILPAVAADGDPGVARVSVLRGQVDLKRADSGDTIAAAINAPVSVGDYLSTQNDARAEVEFDYGAAVRIAAATQLRFTRLEPQHHELQLAQGTLELRVFRGLDGHPQIDTPQGAIRPDASGRYRVSVADDGATTVTVRSGRADVVTDSGSRTIEAGEALLVTGDAGAAQFRSTAFAQSDAFDRWNEQRDAYVARAQDHAYTDAGIVGADDLDAYGNWVDDTGYGRVWVPRQSAGWAPYHDGRWNWQPYYGWTWVAAEPWGWAPYHYGNWFYAASPGWCWYPGSFGQPFVYRPALVAFFSFGGLSSGFGNIGWVPLAPFETFRPWYGRGFYNGTTVINNVTNVSTTNVTNVTNGNVIHDLRNVGAPGGAVAVNASKFAAGDFRHVVDVPRAHLADVAPVRGIVPVVPTHANLAVTNVVPAAPHASTITVARFARFGEPAVTPRTFDLQQTDVKALARRSYPKAAALFEQQDVLLRDGRPHPAAVTTSRVLQNSPPRVEVLDLSAPAVQKATLPAPAARAGDTPALRTPAVSHSLAEPAARAASPWDRFKAAGLPAPSKAAEPTALSKPDLASPAHVTRPPSKTRPLLADKGAPAVERADPFSRFHGGVRASTPSLGEFGPPPHAVRESSESSAQHVPNRSRTMHEPSASRTVHEPSESRVMHEPGEAGTVRGVRILEGTSVPNASARSAPQAPERGAGSDAGRMPNHADSRPQGTSHSR